jgi:nitroreductase
MIMTNPHVTAKSGSNATNPNTTYYEDARVRLMSALVRERRSTRAFLSAPVPRSTIEAALEDAQQTPSNCNTQPWETHIVSGATRQRLSDALHAAAEAGEPSLDFTFDTSLFSGRMSERHRAQGAEYHTALGISRTDYEARGRKSAENLSFFGAPHAALLFMPILGDGVRVASDVGMYAQTFLLALEARGVSAVPQTSLGFYAEPTRRVLGLGPDRKLLFGISFGYPDTTAAGYGLVMGRDPIDYNVTFHD